MFQVWQTWSHCSQLSRSPRSRPSSRLRSGVERRRSRSVHSRTPYSPEPRSTPSSGFSERSRVIAARLNDKWNNFFSTDSTYHTCTSTNSYSVLQCSGCNPARLASISTASCMLPTPPPTPPCTSPTPMSNPPLVLPPVNNEPISTRSQEAKERSKPQRTQERKVRFENTEKKKQLSTTL